MAKRIRPRGIRRPAKPVDVDRSKGITPGPGETGPEAAARLRAKRLSGGDERSARAHKAWATRRANGGIGSGREKRTCVLLTNEMKQFARAKGGTVAKGVRMGMIRWMKQSPLEGSKLRTLEDEEREVERQLKAEAEDDDR